MTSPTRSPRATNTTAPGQIAKANELLTELATVNGEFANQVWAELKERWAHNTCSAAFVSEQITSMIEAKRVSRRLVEVKDLPQVPDGRYALRGEGDVVRFYRVARKNGRYTLFIFASDTQHIIHNWGTALGVLRQIANRGLAESATLFGVEMGVCHRCGRALTDATSRAMGIGPDCAKK